MKEMLRILVGVCGILLWSCTESETYEIAIIGDNEIVIDGQQTEQAWMNIKPFRAFVNPWNSEVQPSTTLKLLRDNKFLYFYFDAKDNEVVVKNPFEQERDVELEDRVELFFSKDSTMQQYYCFEIDALGRTLSYGARHYRQMDFDWNVPEEYQVRTTSYEGGYRVEGAIPWDFIASLTDKKSIYMGAYRAEFSMKNDSIVENWLTWVNPNTPSPDFHVPTSLGVISWK
jgi:hypothetical protein